MIFVKTFTRKNELISTKLYDILNIISRDSTTSVGRIIPFKTRMSFVKKKLVFTYFKFKDCSNKIFGDGNLCVFE